MNSSTYPSSHTSQFCFVNCSLRCKCFRLVDRGTRFSVLAAREMEREPRGLWLLNSRSSFFALNRRETLTAQTILLVSSFHFPDYWNFDLKCKHGKFKTVFRAEKLRGLTVLSRKGPEFNIQTPIKQKAEKKTLTVTSKQTIKQNTKQITKNVHKVRALLEFGLSQGVIQLTPDNSNIR